MTVHIPRLPFALDPLMAEAKRRARQRRFLIAVVVLALIGGAAGALAAFRSPNGPMSALPGALGGGSAETRGTAMADFHRLGLSFRYPAGWQRYDCPFGTPTFLVGVTYLTAGARRSRCSQHGAALRRLQANGVWILWVQTPLFSRSANAVVGGQPARIDSWAPYAVKPGSCAAAGGHRIIQAAIHGFAMFACLRGPKLRRSQTAIGQMLASVRFRPRSPTG
jgi:hypothetical protein